MAKAMAGQTVYYSITTANCEHFVHLLRYGRKKSVQADRVSAIIPMANPKFSNVYDGQHVKTMEEEYQSALRNSHPKPGDMIMILRPKLNQWAIYVGDGDIIYPDSGRVVVRKPLFEVAESDLWCINNKLDSSMKPLCVKEIIRNAKAMIGQEIAMSEEEFIRYIRCVKKVGSSSAVTKKVNHATNGANAIGFAIFKIVIYTIVAALGIVMLLSAADILDVCLLPFI
ncbi:phospholipase A and acyltransferase 3-like isoform X2 [Mobula hypostoma]